MMVDRIRLAKPFILLFAIMLLAPSVAASQYASNVSWVELKNVSNVIPGNFPIAGVAENGKIIIINQNASGGGNVTTWSFSNGTVLNTLAALGGANMPRAGAVNWNSTIQGREILTAGTTTWWNTWTVVPALGYNANDGAFGQVNALGAAAGEGDRWAFLAENSSMIRWMHWANKTAIGNIVLTDANLNTRGMHINGTTPANSWYWFVNSTKNSIVFYDSNGQWKGNFTGSSTNNTFCAGGNIRGIISGNATTNADGWFMIDCSGKALLLNSTFVAPPADTTPPRITVVSPSNGTTVTAVQAGYSYPTAFEEFWFNVSSDEPLSSVKVNMTAPGCVAPLCNTNLTLSSVVNSSYWTIYLRSFGNGTRWSNDFYIAKVWANDSAGNLNASVTSNFSVNISNFHNLSTISSYDGHGLNRSFISGPNVTFLHTIGFGGTRAYCWFNIDNGTTYIVSQSCSSNASNIATSNVSNTNGQHVFWGCYNNTFGVTSCTQTFYRIDSTTAITIIHPTNTTYYNVTNHLQATCDESDGILCNDLMNVSLNGAANRTMLWRSSYLTPFNTSPGFNRLVVYNTKANGMTFFKTVNFTLSATCNSTFAGSNRICAGQNQDRISTCTQVGLDLFIFPDYNNVFCPSGCVSGECIPLPSCKSTCSPGASTCSTNDLIFCDDTDGDGCFAWNKDNKTACSNGCASNSCVGSVSTCSPGESRCTAQFVQFCDDDNGDGIYEFSNINRTYCDYGCAMNISESTGTLSAICNYHSFGDTYEFAGGMQDIARTFNTLTAVDGSDPQSVANQLRNRAFLLGILGFAGCVLIGAFSQKWRLAMFLYLLIMAMGAVIGWMPVYIAVPIIMLLGYLILRGGDDG